MSHLSQNERSLNSQRKKENLEILTGRMMLTTQDVVPIYLQSHMFNRCAVGLAPCSLPCKKTRQLVGIPGSSSSSHILPLCSLVQFRAGALGMKEIPLILGVANRHTMTRTPHKTGQPSEIFIFFLHETFEERKNPLQLQVYEVTRHQKESQSPRRHGGGTRNQGIVPH